MESEVKFFRCIIFALHHCVIILISWCKSCHSVTNCTTHIPNYAREAATVRMPWNKTANTPVFTGLPPHVSILTQIEALKVALKMATDAILMG